MSGPDKPKVIGEEWSDERVRSFLDIVPADSAQNVDYTVLFKAYHAMRADDFRRFLQFFSDAGRDINAPDPEGRTLLDRVSEHRRSAAYADHLKAFGAKTSA